MRKIALPVPRYFAAVSVLLLLASCGGNQGSGDGSEPEGREHPDRYTHSTEEAERFVRRYPSLSVGLINYFDPGRATLVERELAADSVVFRLDLTGDFGIFHEAALDLAAELAVKHGWDLTTVSEENDSEGHLASIRVEALGMPVDAEPGTHVPVLISLPGDANSIFDGYLYPTPLRNETGKTLALWEGGYLPRKGEKSTDEYGREIPGSPPLMEQVSSVGRISYLLREGFRIVSDLEPDDLTAETITLPLDRELVDEEGRPAGTVLPFSADLLPQVTAGIEEEMANKGIQVSARAEGLDKLVITLLGVRDRTVLQVFEELQTIRVTLQPRSNVIVVFDDELHRVVFYGPQSHRFLVGPVALSVDPFTRNTRDRETGERIEPRHLRFRVNCRVLEEARPGRSGQYGVPSPEQEKRGETPDGDPGKVHLAWTLRSQEGELLAEGDEDFPSADVSEILRRLWIYGMGPHEALAFVVEAVDQYALVADLGFNPRRFNPDSLDNR